jgi:hypothetical protein
MFVTAAGGRAWNIVLSSNAALDGGACAAKARYITSLLIYIYVYKLAKKKKNTIMPSYILCRRHYGRGQTNDGRSFSVLFWLHLSLSPGPTSLDYPYPLNALFILPPAGQLAIAT